MTEDPLFGGKGVIQHFVDAGAAMAEGDAGKATAEAGTGVVKGLVKLGLFLLTGGDSGS